MIKIYGFRGKIQDIEHFLEETSKIVNKGKQIDFQVFDGEMIYGENHLISAYEHAKRAIKQDENTCNSLAMEILLYASGERQLKQAIPKMGIKKNSGKIVFIFFNKKIGKKTMFDESLLDSITETFSLKRDDKIIEGDINTLRKFGIEKKETSTVSENEYGDLILERVAMVDLLK
ncbi:MAG: KEOPS complex subunit Cgi121 [Candidatus Thermoplasmatota archaeon]